MKRRDLGYFVLGVGFYSSVHMAVQDWLGVEKFVMFVRQNWIDLPWYVGALSAAFLLGLAIFDPWTRKQG